MAEAAAPGRDTFRSASAACSRSNRASIAAEAGRITALIGPNGAGKTTLFSIITGFLPPSEGRIVYARRRYHRRAAAPAGPARHRPHLPDRAAVCGPDGAGEHRGRFAFVAAARAPMRSPLPATSRARSGLAICSTVRPQSLTVAGRKRLELARALAIEPRLLLLDEVLAGLNPSEIRDMVPVIRAVCDRGITIVMIEHVMQAVMSLAENVFVLSEGRIIAEGSPRAIAGDPRVVEAYLGKGAAGRMTAAGSAPMPEALLAISGLRAGYGATEILRGVDLTVGARRNRRRAGLERHREIDPQPHHLRRHARLARHHPLPGRGDRARAAGGRSSRAA